MTRDTISTLLWHKNKDKINSLMWKRASWLAVKLHSLGHLGVTENAEFMEAYLRLIGDGGVFLTFRDMFNLYLYVSRGRELGGDMAEVGVFRGRGAKLISTFKGKATLHLFDTFEGMPETDKIRDNYYKKGDFQATSLAEVQAYLQEFSHIEYYKGYFPKSASNTLAASRKFSLVHLDVDIYQSILDGLRFFYPRLVEGGSILCHDYCAKIAPGVKAAIDVFCAETGAVPTPLWDTHCLMTRHRPATADYLVENRENEHPVEALA